MQIFPEGEVSIAAKSGSLIWWRRESTSVPPVPGGGYGTVTGTSFATPFVSGAAALLNGMGHCKGNDPYLYGEKVKAYLRRERRPPLAGIEDVSECGGGVGGGRYNKVTLKKVSKIKCFRSFSQHRNEAVSP